MTRYSIHILAILLLLACTKENETMSVPDLQLMEIPPGFPVIAHPSENEFSLERWNLGKKLFFDPILSKDGKVSCASCHHPELAFSDQEAVSIGSEGLKGRRNAPTLTNVAYHPYFTREGGVPTLEMQVLVPIQEHDEFNNNVVLIADTLSTISEYIEMSQKAYAQDPNPFVITRAISLFERSLISGQSDFDMEFNYGIENTMNPSALRGKILFESDRTSCSSCHGGFNFTDYSFKNNGLYEEYADEGRYRLTQNADDVALFKVPTLRNIEVTGPYMHDGSLTTLREVIEHYNNGGKNHINKDIKIRPLNLKEEEMDDLEAFLRSLTDTNFLQNKNFSNE